MVKKTAAYTITGTCKNLMKLTGKKYVNMNTRNFMRKTFIVNEKNLFQKQN